MSAETDPTVLMKMLSDMVNSVAADKLRSLTVSAYDACALKAMESLLDKEGLPREGEEADFAAVVWSIADAMMIERAKRGLGQIIAVPVGSVVVSNDAPPNGQAS